MESFANPAAMYNLRPSGPTVPFGAAGSSSVFGAPPVQGASSKTWVYIMLGLTIVAVLGVGLYFFLKQQKKSSSDDSSPSRLAGPMGPMGPSGPSGPMARFRSPESWSAMPMNLRMKAEESFQRIAHYYVTQKGLEPLDAQLKAVEDVENHIRAQMAASNGGGSAAGSAGARREVHFNDVVKVDPSEVEGMPVKKPQQQQHVSEEESLELEKMRPKQRMSMETKKRAESLAAAREADSVRPPSSGSTNASSASHGGHAHDENFTPL